MYVHSCVHVHCIYMYILYIHMFETYMYIHVYTCIHMYTKSMDHLIQCFQLYGDTAHVSIYMQSTVNLHVYVLLYVCCGKVCTCIKLYHIHIYTYMNVAKADLRILLLHIQYIF